MEEFIIKDGCKRVIVDFDARTIVQEFEEKFEPKDGDFCVTDMGSISIYKCPDCVFLDIEYPDLAYVGLTDGKLYYNSWYKSIRLATDSERQQLIDALAKEGKAWNAEKKMIVKKRWRAEFGGVYYVVNDCGTIVRCTERKDAIDQYRYNFGNYHKTREDAEAYMGKIFKLRND